MELLIDWLFFVAGGALIAHILLCVILQFRLRGHDELARQLMAVPNQVLLSDGARIRLLRARYYLPWVSAGTEKSGLDVTTRLVILAARLTGFVFPAAALGFLVASVLQSDM